MYQADTCGSIEYYFAPLVANKIPLYELVYFAYILVTWQ